MRSTLKVLGCLAVLAAPLCVGFPVYAQQSGGQPSQMGQSSQMEGPAHGGAFEGDEGHAWNGDCPERQEIREERERIRAEHEELDSAHDRLKAQCMNTKGQDRSECIEKKKDLQARMEALHERMKALHAKAEADPGCHHHGHGANKGQWPSHQGQANTPPVQAPSTTY